MIRKILLCFCVIIAICSCNNNERVDGRNPRDRKENLKVDELKEGKNETPIGETNMQKKPVVNVYIENSGSMDGYVQGTADFKTTVYSYLQYIKIQNVCDSLNLFYLNSRIFPQGTVTDDNLEVLKYFVERLDPNSFRLKGTVPGENSRGTSDIDDLLRSIIKTTNENIISILVTDGIFSPGRGRNANEYIAAQKIGLMGTFSTLMDKINNAAVVLYKMESQFDGIYYDKIDTKIPFKGLRPYYIWVVGSAENIAELLNKVPNSKFNNKPEEIFMISEVSHQPKYIVDDNFGNHKKNRNNNYVVEGLTKDKSGKVRFAVKVDFSGVLVDESYLSNPDNYFYNLNNYSLEIQKLDKNPKYTHKLKFTSKDARPHPGVMSIKLKMEEPKWAESSNDNYGETPLDGKTYGLKYQLDGLYEAFTKNMKDNQKYYNDIKITIQ